MPVLCSSFIGKLTSLFYALSDPGMLVVAAGPPNRMRIWMIVEGGPSAMCGFRLLTPFRTLARSAEHPER